MRNAGVSVRAFDSRSMRETWELYLSVGLCMLPVRSGSLGYWGLGSWHSCPQSPTFFLAGGAFARYKTSFSSPEPNVFLSRRSLRTKKHRALETQDFRLIWLVIGGSKNVRFSKIWTAQFLIMAIGKFLEKALSKTSRSTTITFVVAVTVLVRNHPVVFRKEKAMQRRSC